MTYDADFSILYIFHVLSFLGCHTSVAYHATRVVITSLDAVQSKFLKYVGVGEVTAIAELNLAPLAVRRGIAMLCYRTTFGKGPCQLAEHFRGPSFLEAWFQSARMLT